MDKNKNNDLGVVSPEFIEIFRNGVTIAIGDGGKPSGVYMNTLKSAVGRGITVNPVFVELVKDKEINLSNFDGNSGRMKASR